MKNKKIRYLKIKKRIYPMKQHSDLFSIDDKKYSDYLPTSKKNTILKKQDIILKIEWLCSCLKEL